MAEERVWSVSEINAAVRNIVEGAFMPFWIRAEIGTFNIYRSGHVYLTLKDEKSNLKAVFFSGSNRAKQLDLKVGTKVDVFGNLSVYEIRGEYQFIIRSVRPVGIGDLQRRFEELKQKLNAEGLFDESRKKTIPMLPQRIGVVSSPDGAAVRDFLNIINRRFPNIHIQIYPAACQGKGAGNKLAAGIEFFNRLAEVDVLVLTRGGGSMEDLWPFNEEVLARAIAGSRIPVVSAVGHEIDFTISDFVADLRVATPSSAAELVVGKREEFQEKLLNLRRRQINSLESSWTRLIQRYNMAAQSYVFKEPIHLVREKQQIVDELCKTMHYCVNRQKERDCSKFEQLKTRFAAVVPTHLLREKKQKIHEMTKVLEISMNRLVEQKKAYLEQLESRLQSVNPMSVINRGYAILTDKETGKTITTSKVLTGTILNAKVADGQIELEVKK